MSFRTARKLLQLVFLIFVLFLVGSSARPHATLEQRQEIVRVHEEHFKSVDFLVVWFRWRWSRATIYRILRQYKLQGTVTVRGDRAEIRYTSMSDDELHYLLELTETKPHLFLDEYQRELHWKCGRVFSISQIERKLLDHKITVKVLERRAAQRDADERRAVLQTIRTYNSRCLIFIDESHTDDRDARRRRGRARRGVAPTLHEEYRRGHGRSIIAALNQDGFVIPACSIVEKRGVDDEQILAWAEHFLVPELNPWNHNAVVPNSVVVCDNASIHHSPEFRAIIAATGAVLIYLSPYSPDMNPIEEGFSTVKYFMRRHTAQLWAMPELWTLHALASVTAKSARGYFRDCGIFCPEPKQARDEQHQAVLAACVFMALAMMVLEVV